MRKPILILLAALCSVGLCSCRTDSPEEIQSIRPEAETEFRLSGELPICPVEGCSHSRESGCRYIYYTLYGV